MGRDAAGANAEAIRKWFDERELSEILSSVFHASLGTTERSELLHFFISAKENGFDDSLRSSDRSFDEIFARFSQVLLEKAPRVHRLLPREELKSSWVRLYENPNQPEISPKEVEDALVDLLSTRLLPENNQLWISNVLYRFRQASRVSLKSDLRKRNLGDKSEHSQVESWEWIFQCYSQAEDLVRAVDASLSASFNFLLHYEKAVLFAKFGSPTRALDSISRCNEILLQTPNLEGDKIVHIAMLHPSEYLLMLTSLTKSRFGMHVDHSKLHQMVDGYQDLYRNTQKRLSGGFQDLKDDDASEFDQLSIGVLHYFTLLTMGRCGIPMLNDSNDGPWNVFQRLYPTFYVERVKNHVNQLENASTPWSNELIDAFDDLSSNQSDGERRDLKIRELAKKGKDLSVNNPLAFFRKMNINPKQETTWKAKSSLAASINYWISYIDLVKMNFLRVTKSDGSHHFVRYGPFDRITNNLSWIQSAYKGDTVRNVETEFRFDQYLSQSFRISSEIKSTKMDRANLLATILAETIDALEEHVPPTNALKSLKKLPRAPETKALTRPILHPKKTDGDNPFPRTPQLPSSKHAAAIGAGLPVALHAHVAFERVIKIHKLTSQARAMLMLSSIQSTHRDGIEFVLDEIEELLGLEFLHLMVIFRSYDFEASTYDARTIIEEITHGFDLCKSRDELSVPERNKYDQIKFDFYENRFTKKSGANQMNSALSDPRVSSILDTLRRVGWWNFQFEDLDEHVLAKTMVAWLEHQVESGPAPIVHSRFLEGGPFFIRS